ncbi:putative integral membrane protein [Rosellinia necatrix]|uniref:Putative integral membrane protein n=1 Tax=Rosellinia necatrix TaxID=77044 RepID=A0A1W2TG26_ROSNE|nr:putative integral membrane protein [Rosellinia necatrix]
MFGVFRNYEQKAYFFVAIVFTPLSIAAVVLRFWAVKRAGLKHYAEDWLALISLIIHLAYTGITLADEIIGNGRDTFALVKTPADLIVVRKVTAITYLPSSLFSVAAWASANSTPKLTYTALWTYSYQQLFAKLSIMALYYRIFKVNRRFVHYVYTLFVYHIAWIIEVTFLLGFHCRPLAKFWNLLLPGQCIQEGTFIAVSGSINSLGDFLLVALSIAMVRTLQMPSATKWKLAFLFGLGVLSGIIGFVKIGESFNTDAICEFPAAMPCMSRVWTNPPCFYIDVFTIVALWSNVQAVVSLICCCAPVYKPILPAAGFWTRLMSKVSMASLRQRSSHSNRSSGSFERAGSRDQQQHWERRHDGHSKGRVWSGDGELGAEEGFAGNRQYPLESIQVQRDYQVSR